jgi:carbonic anhydrase/acetyltransferase-like protein (isoleucine patch superfamily)
MPLYRLGDIHPQCPAEGSYWLAPDAHIIGDVMIGVDVSVWFGAVLRGDNERITVGKRSNIQEGAMLHTDIGYPLEIGDSCTIGHHAILHGCTLGENTLVGMGACIMNGARIGKNCLIGAYALITEGKEYPDNTLIVGSPARALKTIDEAGVLRLKASADHYVANSKRFARELSLCII